jgi:hypothetical protein
MKILMSLLIVLVAVLAFTASLDRLVGMTPVSRLDRSASGYFDRAVTKALATYAVARMLNAAISVVQGTELAVSPAGMGVRLSVGEILDPINDLIERFSWVILLSTVSLGVQKVLMEIGVWAGFRVLVFLSMVVLLAGIWFKREGNWNLRAMGFRILLASIVVRFCIPVIGVTSNALYDSFLDETYSRSTNSLDVIRGKIRMPITHPEQEGEPDQGLLGRLKEKYQDTKAVLNVPDRLEALKDTVEDGIDHITNLIIVFLLQTIIIPLLVLWGLLRLTGMFMRGGWAPAGRLLKGPSTEN